MDGSHNLTLNLFHIQTSVTHITTDYTRPICIMSFVVVEQIIVIVSGTKETNNNAEICTLGI